MDAPRTDAVRTATRQGLSVGIATALYGVSLGALAVANGLTVWQACVTSLLLFSGGSQFALVGVLGAGGSAGAAIAASSLLGVRNALYGLQLAPLLRLPARWRPVAAHLTIDESTAVAIAQPDTASRRRGFWVTGVTVFVGWNVMTLLGALAGDALGDPRRYGLDAAAAAAFRAAVAAVAEPRTGRGGDRRRRRRRGAHPGRAAGDPGRRRGRRRGARGPPAPTPGGADPVTTWLAVLGACAVAYGLKLAGHLVPARWLEHPTAARVTTMLPVALLAALVVVQTVATGDRFVVDARVVGLGVAAVALVLRAPFVVVVVLAAVAAALVRAAGWG